MQVDILLWEQNGTYLTTYLGVSNVHLLVWCELVQLVLVHH